MSVSKEIKNGILISAIGKYSNYIIQFSILAILSRILSPSEFGIVAIVNVLLVFFNMLIDMGIGPAVIQNKTLSKEQTDNIFTFSVLLSFLLSLVFALISKPVALFYDDNRLITVCIYMSIALFTSGLNMVPQAVLLKQKRFKEVNYIQITSNLIYGFVGICLAYLGFSYFSLILGTIIKNIVCFLGMIIKSNLIIRKKISVGDLKLIYSFSRNQFLFNIINYFSRNLDNVLIGKYMSIKSLAYYDKAYTLSLYPNSILTNVITPIIQPIMSEYEQQKDVIKNTYISISRILSILSIPLTVFLFFSSKEIIYILFGAQWDGSVNTFRILSISVWIQVILSSTGAIFQSANRTDLLLISGILSTFLNVSSILVGVWTGKIEWVATILVISFFANFIQANYLLMNKIFKSKQFEFYKVLIRPFIIAIFMVAGMLIFQSNMPNLPIVIILIIKGFISLIIFLAGAKPGKIKRLIKRNKKIN